MKFTPDKEVLYEIIGILSKADLPIIFKGANVTNILLQQSNSPYTRMTTDIDSSWHGKNPTTDNIEELLRQALQPYGYDVSKVRNMEGSKVSAGFRVLKDGIPITKMDIDIHKVNHSEKYSFGTVEFTGVSVEEILSDKICAISNEHIFRRTKDLLDIYSLTQALNVSPLRVYETIKKSDNKLGDFAEFVINKDLLGEAYSHLKVTNKPDFEEVYDNVSKYIKEINKVITEETNKDIQKEDKDKIDDE